MEQLNILIALPNDKLGGAEQYLKMVSRQFINRNYNVYVLFLKKRKFDGWHDLSNFPNIHLKYTTADSESKGIMPFLKHVFLLRKINFEYIFTSHIHINSTVGFLVKVGIIKKKHFIGRESTSIFHRFSELRLLLLFFRFQYWLGYSSLDLLICQTEFMRNQLVEALPSLNNKIDIRVLPNPIDIDIAKDVSFDKEVIGAYGNYITSAGRLIPEKGFDILIASFSEIKKQYHDLNLVILGEGEQRPALEKLIIELGMEKSVFLIGFVKDVYTYFKYAQLCVVSSRIEGFPNVLLQMMSQNHKVVSTKCAGGIDEIPGIEIAEIHDADSLKNAILNALKTDTKNNRHIFDSLLNDRSIDKFMHSIDLIVT